MAEDVVRAPAICRGQTLKYDTILRYVEVIPKTPMKKEEFDATIEAKFNGWTTTHYQPAKQAALFYEENGICYPRFGNDVSVEEVVEYIIGWATKYFAPNPITRDLKMVYSGKPINIYAYLRKNILDGNTNFEEVCNSMFDGVDELTNIDKIKAYITAFTNIKIDEMGEMSLRNGIYDENVDVFPPVSNDITGKEYFMYFSSNQKTTHKIKRDYSSLQRIYYGAPGTGKSRNVKDLTKGESVIRTTFHPDSDYSTFVGCYKPTTRTKVRYDFYKGKAIPVTYENGEEFTEEYIVYEFVEQAFLQAYIQAWRFYGDGNKDGEGVKKQFLIIEEINRGNCAQIFGDLFQLLDRNEYGFSDYYIHADNDMRTHLEKAFQQLKESGVPQKDHINAICNEGLEEERREDFVDKVLSGEILLLPDNLYIWATMNTSDQSLFPIDSAFKRRWDWEYVPIKDFRSEDRKIKAKDRETGEIVYYDWGKFMEEINKKIYATTNSADKQLGYFFCDVDENKVISTETFVNKVVFYLWNDVFKDFGFSDDIFADKYDKENSRLTFDKFFKDDKVKMGELVSVFMENLNLPTVEPPTKVASGEQDGSNSDEDDFIDEDDDMAEVSSQRDRSKYSVNGEGSYNKGELVRKVVELYIDKHPGITSDKLIEDFEGVKVANRKKNFLNEAEYEEWLDSHSADKYREIRYRRVSKNGVNVYATTQIRIDFMDDFIEKVRSWGIEIKKVE